MNQEEIKEQIKAFFKEYSDHTPDDDEDLFESGALDSFGIVEFLSFLDDSLNISFDIEDITADNFSTLEKIVELIQK